MADWPCLPRPVPPVLRRSAMGPGLQQVRERGLQALIARQGQPAMPEPGRFAALVVIGMFPPAGLEERSPAPWPGPSRTITGRTLRHLPGSLPKHSALEKTCLYFSAWLAVFRFFRHLGHQAGKVCLYPGGSNVWRFIRWSGFNIPEYNNQLITSATPALKARVLGLLNHSDGHCRRQIPVASRQQRGVLSARACAPCADRPGFA